MRGRLCDLDRHLDRLDRSLAALRDPVPDVARGPGAVILRESLRRNGLRDAAVYVQVDRGVAPRNHLFPKQRAAVADRHRPPRRFPEPAELAEGVGVVTLPDQRWKRCDIKSVSLLANVLARQQAAEAGCREVWLLRRGRPGHRGLAARTPTSSTGTAG